MKKAKSIGAHQSATMRTDEWLTPPAILKVLGEFDLDPCAPIHRPWDTAKHHYTLLDDGLRQEWSGRVWMNPPYGAESERWVQKLAGHGNGLALIFARTETGIFFPWVWDYASGLLFLKGRLTFFTVEGKPAVFNGGAPSVLIAYGQENADVLLRCGLAGKFVPLQPITQRKNTLFT